MMPVPQPTTTPQSATSCQGCLIHTVANAPSPMSKVDAAMTRLGP